ncbi:hypothetical protein Bbelb_290300 [Branchiostoma belcheri]|nr:hypothetical protein Bbelb_290300 [Branchiostoma belcheri]
MENLQTFSRDDTVTWAEDLAPMSVGMLKALLQNRAAVSSRMGMMLSMALYNRRLKFVQAAMSVQLWRQGCPQNIFTTLNSLGICQSLKSARGPTDCCQDTNGERIQAVLQPVYAEEGNVCPVSNLRKRWTGCGEKKGPPSPPPLLDRLPGLKQFLQPGKEAIVEGQLGGPA